MTKKDHLQRWRAKRKKEGGCIGCFRKALPNKTHCNRCRTKINKYYNEKRNL